MKRWSFVLQAPLSIAGDRNNPAAPSSLKHANTCAARAQCAQEYDACRYFSKTDCECAGCWFGVDGNNSDDVSVLL
jgi:hypothetical protein